MAKLTDMLEQTDAAAILSRRHREDAEIILDDIDSMDNSHLSTGELDFIERAANATYVAEGTIRHLERIRDKLQRMERRGH
jgi:hypothetical protein